MVPDYETDVVRVIHNNKSGASITVRPDRDGLGMVEVDGGDDFGRLCLQPHMAKLLADAMDLCAQEEIQKAALQEANGAGK